MATFRMDKVVPARRLRDAVRMIRAFPTSDREKKYLLGEWLFDHEGATKDKGARHQAYNQLLGRRGNRRLGGGR